jgi:hypothetical protein
MYYTFFFRKILIIMNEILKRINKEKGKIHEPLNFRLE